MVRAIVPGLELTADFDAHSRPSVRLFRRYLEKAGSFEREEGGGRRNFLEKVSPPPPQTPPSTSKTFVFIQSLFPAFPRRITV